MQVVCIGSVAAVEIDGITAMLIEFLLWACIREEMATKPQHKPHDRVRGACKWD